MHQVFIDGEAGTTGLQIRQRLDGRTDITLIRLDDARRKDPVARAEALAAADIAILCLPDGAARQAVELTREAGTRLIDASTAHRVAEGWVYGFTEMTAGQADAIARARWVANPGCYPTGSIGILRPLVEAGLLPRDYPVTIHAVSGYTGGGKTLIARMEDPTAEAATDSPFFVYGLTLAHKHLPEITARARLDRAPVFVPSVGRFAQGMIVQVPLHLRLLTGAPGPADLRDALAAHYAAAAGAVRVATAEESAAVKELDPRLLNHTDGMLIHVFGNAAGDQAVVMAVLDNLGKGASGAAVQNLDLMLRG